MSDGTELQKDGTDIIFHLVQTVFIKNGCFPLGGCAPDLKTLSPRKSYLFYCVKYVPDVEICTSAYADV